MLFSAGAVALAVVVLAAPGQERAAAEAYAVRRAADVQAEQGRAAIQAAEREAGHQRALEVLPYVLAVVGGIVLLGGLGAVVILALERGRPDPVLLAYLERQRLEQAELWHVVGQLARDRQRLPGGDNRRGEVVLFQERRQ
jgi:hypothetical protein